MKKSARLLVALAALCGAPVAGAHAAPSPVAALASLPAMKTIDVYGQPIRYFETGTGPTLVLVHGFGSNARFDWGRVIPELSKHYHILAMDQLGFGSSAKPPVLYGVQTWVDMLDGFLKAKHVTHFMLAGESLGGWIAGLYTVEASERKGLLLPERLLLCDAAGHRSLVMPPGKRPFSSALSFDSVRQGLGALFHDKSLITDDLVQLAFETRLAEGTQITQDIFRNNLNESAPYLDDRSSVITVPTMIVWGDDDQIVPIAAGRDYAAKIKGARMVVIPQSGHGPMIEQPQAFLNAVSGFLAEGR